MPVEMKKGIRKRIACMMGTTQKAIREAEAECDTHWYDDRNRQLDVSKYQLSFRPWCEDYEE